MYARMVRIRLCFAQLVFTKATVKPQLKFFQVEKVQTLKITYNQKSALGFREGNPRLNHPGNRRDNPRFSRQDSLLNSRQCSLQVSLHHNHLDIEAAQLLMRATLHPEV